MIISSVIFDSVDWHSFELQYQISFICSSSLYVAAFMGIMTSPLHDWTGFGCEKCDEGSMDALNLELWVIVVNVVFCLRVGWWSVESVNLVGEIAKQQFTDWWFVSNRSLFNEPLFSAPNHLSERLKITGTRPRSVKKTRTYKEISSFSVLWGFEGISCAKKSWFEGSTLIQSS